MFPTNTEQRLQHLSTRNLAELLELTRAHWEERKRRRTQGTDGSSQHLISEQPNVRDAEHLTPPRCEPVASKEVSGSDLYQIDVGAVDVDLIAEVQEAVSDVSGFICGLLTYKLRIRLQSSRSVDLPVANRKPKRPKSIPARYAQESPEPSVQTPAEEGEVRDRAADTAAFYIPATILESLREVREQTVKISDANVFGVKKRYTFYTSAGEEGRKGANAADSAASSRPSTHLQSSANQVHVSFGPFENKSGFLLAEWYWNSTQKSFGDFQKLVSIFRDPDFRIIDSVKVNWKSAFKSLGANRDDLRDEDAMWIEDDGWRVTEITIDIPFHSQTKDPGTKSYIVGNFRHRALLSVIKEKLTSQHDPHLFHYYPYEDKWKPNAFSAESTLYGELYTSRAFREAHEDLQRQPSTSRNKGLERVIVALMFWSDATQLTSFGGAGLWPCYLFFGNESKYRRAQPSERLGHQVAYFMKLPDHLNDHLKDRNGGKLPTDALFAYCARELFHKQWSVLLDSEFSAAVKEGIVLRCPDGKERCFYPRIFTYAADYPEKTLVAGIRNNGGHPCHRCLVKKEDIYRLGSPSDTARSKAARQPDQQKATILQARTEIEKGYAVNSSTFEESLKALSLVPIESAFETSLSFDITEALVVDVLHEFEIGVWKRLYIHLMRLLHAFSSGEGVTLTAELDSRYRATPSFGRDTIRKFPLNASQMRRKAARDFENLLQCAIPAFESLIPEPHNSILMKLLYLCGQWHALAKLRLHTDSTLLLLEYTTACLGSQMRIFDRTTCSPTPTKELEKEAEARARRDIKKSKGKGSASRRPAQLGIYTIKFHFLGDYASIIRQFGTTDSFSTQIGELYHRIPKSWYARTDRKDYETQLSQTERRQARLSQIRAGLHAVPIENVNPLGEPSPFSERYSIGTNQNCSLRLDSFGEDVSKLKRHLLPRILQKMGCSLDSVGRNAWQHVVLHEQRLYSHKLMRMAYTTYDTTQGEDVVHVDTPQCNVMLLNRDYTLQDSNIQSPYLYAKVEGIFHANVSLIGILPASGSHHQRWHRLDFVYVNWWRFLRSESEFAMDRVEPALGPDARAFIDPNDILRGIHLIPQFAGKRHKPGALPPNDDMPREEQRDVHYINRHVFHTTDRIRSCLLRFVTRFADRDTFMRFQYGMSVGHTYMHESHFPSAVIPSIPTNFDWCLDIPSNGGDNDDGEEEMGWSGGIGYERQGGLEDMDDRELAVYQEMYD
ncbi:hypothetical protein NMY22_g9993 [Coprinellus aureogranulatus]|nr:hypothetical protein NMY22_g9993 [Coprinellus aureogranulatus]